MWDQMFRRWVDLFLWWLPREPTGEARSAGADEPATGPGPAAAAEPETKAEAKAPDDLTVIKGIGPVVQDKLRDLGIVTFHDLARADPDDLLAQLKGSQPVSLARVRAWTEAARERSEARA